MSVMSHNQRFLSYSQLAIAVFLIFVLSCNPSRSKKGTAEVKSDSLASSFVPQPQKVEKQEVKILATGDSAPGFNLPDINGKFYSLDDFRKSKVLIIIFTCNHCPTAQAYEDRIIRFTEDYKDKGVSVVAIMPNSSFGLLPEECAYSDLDDSYESMAIRAKDKAFNFPYLYDGDNQSVSIMYGPTATPHAFVFNKARKLAYSGRIDDSEKPGTGNAGDLRAAVNSLLAGEEVRNPVNKAFGCSVKWGWKSDWTDKVNADWNNKPVTLNLIDKHGIKDLLSNSSGKLRLINIWATWCAPCVIEYPELVKLQRIYGNRDFEFVSVSADKPEKKEKVLEFLQTNHSATTNYIFNSDNSYELVEAIDPEWNGAIPYSLLIEPGGKVIFRNQGIVDILELKKNIVENPLLGRYY
jgi:thiol-disulfide isomerase/thioredoxin